MPIDSPRRSCCDQDFERLFDAREARHDLEQWRRGAVPAATRELIDAIRGIGVRDATLLDIGAGVGIIHLELLEAGAASAVDVDASSAYLEAAAAEAARRGLADRVTYHLGDIVEIAPDLHPAQIVTLDRVICCYPDLPAMLGAAVMPGTQVIGLVHPTDRWWMRASMAGFNAVSRLLRRRHSFYVHRRAEVDRLMRDAGFAESHRGGGRIWQVAVYRRAATSRA